LEKYRDLAPVAIDYSVSDDGDTFRVNWTILTTYIDGITPEVESDFISDIITKADLKKLICRFILRSTMMTPQG